MDIKKTSMKNIIFLIIFSIFIWWLFENFKFVGWAFGLFLEIIAPFIIGLVIAFILNKPMTFLEKKLFNKKGLFKGKISKYKRPISLLITIIFFALVIALVLILVIPNLIAAGKEIAEKIPSYWDNLQVFVENSSKNYPQINDQIKNIKFNDITSGLFSFLRGGLSNWIGSTFSVVTSIISVFVSVVIGFVFSIYFLLQKESLIIGLKKFIYAIFPLRVSNRIVYIGKITNEAFSDFLFSQSIIALILGLLFLVIMLIFGFPYALMISVIISLTTFIPLIGPFIGLIVGAFLIFVEDPKMAGFFIILFLVLQQLEGNLIFPKVVGKASGLSPVWILAAVTIGGSVFGIIGIVIFVPLFTVIHKLLKEYTDRKLEEKKIDKF